MRLALSLTVGIVTVLTAAACGGGAAPPPAPVVNQDSIDAARRRQQAIQDSIAREQARRDSLNRLAEAARARQADSILAETNAVRAMIARVINFDYDKSAVRPGMDTEVLEEKLRILQANPGLVIEVTGHADERGSDEYNLALGNRRAIAAKQYLTTRGVDQARITTRSMGEEQPADPASNEQAWARNRRDEFTISSGGAQLRRP